jgi:hypothetical protein
MYQTVINQLLLISDTCMVEMHGKIRTRIKYWNYVTFLDIYVETHSQMKSDQTRTARDQSRLRTTHITHDLLREDIFEVNKKEKSRGL